MTSGTTGTPKGAPREKINPLQSAQLLDRVPWPSGASYYVAAPLFHATGLATCALGLSLGNRVVLARRFDPESTLAAIDRYRVQALVVVPTMLQRILDLGPQTLARYDTSSLRVVFAAGSALSPELCRRTAAAFGEVLYNLYGSTEVAAAALATPPTCGPRRARSAGRRSAAGWPSTTVNAVASPHRTGRERCLSPAGCRLPATPTAATRRSSTGCCRPGTPGISPRTDSGSSTGATTR